MKAKTSKATAKIISKQDLVDRVRKETDLTKSQTELAITSFLQEVNEALIKGEEVRLVGHFTLKTDWKAEGKAMNLQTGKPIKVPAHYTPKCKFSAELKKQIRERKKK